MQLLRPELSDLQKLWQKSIGSRGITVNAVAPGFIDTDMTQSLPEKVVEGYACPDSSWKIWRA